MQDTKSMFEATLEEHRQLRERVKELRDYLEIPRPAPDSEGSPQCAKGGEAARPSKRPIPNSMRMADKDHLSTVLHQRGRMGSAPSGSTWRSGRRRTTWWRRT